MTTLIVTLPNAPADATTLLGYVLSADGRTSSEHSSAPPALLPTANEVVALVPAHRLSWHQVTLPKGTLARGVLQDGGTARLRAVLDGMLEDRLLDDGALLHFAIEPNARAETPVWVAVCERAWLRSALQTLERAARPVSRIVPEFAPDALPETLYVMGEPDQAQLVFTARGGVAVWPLSAASVALLSWPDGQRIVAEPAVAALAEQLFQRSVTLQPGTQRSLDAMQSSWDLAQFDLVNSGRARAWKRGSGALRSFLRAPAWRAARLALLALVAVNVLGLNAWAWQEQAQVNALRQAVRELLTSTFPQVRVVVDAPLQMAREVAALQQASGNPSGRDLETLLGIFGMAAPADSVPSAIEFVAGELRMKGLSLSPEALTQVVFKLKPQGYTARQDGERLVIQQGVTP